jgi:hypothetical protein
VILENGAFPGYGLCANPNDESVYLQLIDASNPNWAYCRWQQFGATPDRVVLYNPAKNQVMAYTTNEAFAVVMEDYGTSPLGESGELWSWGGQQVWGSGLLQSVWDSGQNIDAKATDGDYPRTDAVHTRDSLNGYVSELTWSAIAAD